MIDVLPGKHEKRTIHDTCPGGDTNSHTETTTNYPTHFDTYVWHWSCGPTNGVMTVAGTNAMAKVKFICTPDNLPSNEMVTVSNGGHGELYLKEGNVLYLVTSTNLPAFTIASRDFRLHGHTASSKERDGTITIEHQSSGAKDRAFYTVATLVVREVSFSGSNTTLVSDEQDTTFSAPHYLDANEDGDADDPGERSYPISYVRGTNMVVGAKFTVSPALSCEKALVKAAAASAANLPATNATVSGNSILLPPSKTGRLSDAITCLKPMSMHWEVSFDGGGSWMDAGTSTNTLYVTWARPVSSPHIHTYFDVGCEAAAGVSGTVGENDDVVLGRIWTKFQTKSINRASDGRVLTYYGFYDANRNGIWEEGIDTDRNSPTTCHVTSAAELVRTTNGQCHSWAEFMHQVLCAQGLAVVNEKSTARVAVNAVPKREAFLAIKNWDKKDSGPWVPSRSDAGMLGTNVLSSLPEHSAQDVAGVSGQGTSPNPPAGFGNHYIIKCADELYDPSYGLGPFEEYQQYEHAAFDGIIQVSTYGARRIAFLTELPPSGSSNIKYEEGPF